jgi:hypothetical protein
VLFPLPILIPPTAPQSSSSSSESGKIRQLEADVPIGLGLILTQETKEEIKMLQGFMREITLIHEIGRS